MTILALEFSSSQRSVAIARENSVLSEAVETGGRNTAAFRMIEQVLAEIEREEIDLIVVGLGPGSYTGIRAAVSIAQGWQWAAEIKLMGMSSVEAIAAQAQAEKIFGRVNIVIDAQRNEFYRATYEISQSGWKEAEPLRIVPSAEIHPGGKANELLAGPEVLKWFPGGRMIFPRAGRLAVLAGMGNGFVAGERLEPIYLRETNFVKTQSER